MSVLTAEPAEEETQAGGAIVGVTVLPSKSVNVSSRYIDLRVIFPVFCAVMV